MLSPYRDPLGLLITVKILEIPCCHQFGALLTKRTILLHPILQVVAVASCKRPGVLFTSTSPTRTFIQRHTNITQHEHTIHLQTWFTPALSNVYITLSFSSCWTLLFPLHLLIYAKNGFIWMTTTTTTTTSSNKDYYFTMGSCWLHQLLHTF